MNDLAIIDHTARAHSPVGGSSAKRVLNCTASVELCARYPSKTSEFAEEGTTCHEATDMIMQGKVEKDTDVVGLTFNGQLMTEELYGETVEPALDLFDRLQDELGGIDFLNEQRVVFPGIDNAFGTVDIVGTAHDRTVVLDWKYGKGVAVEARANEQLMYYAYAAAHTPATAGFFDRHKPIELFIIQPRVNDGEPFTRWMTTWNQLEVFALELKHAVEVAYSPEAEFKLGPWCKFCNARSGCPLVTNKVEQIQGLNRDQLQAEIEHWLPYADTMASWAEGVKKLAHDLLEQGATIPGYKLVNKRANRAWKDEEKALKFMTRMKLPADQRHVKKLISPAQAEKALKPLGLAALPDDLVEKVSSGTTLAPESDKRPAVVIAPEALRLLAERLSAS